MSVEKALKVLPRIFSLQSNDYSEFLPEDSVTKGIQNRWIALGNRLQNATNSIGSHCNESSQAELEVEIFTSIVLDSLRKELVNAIEESGIDATSLDVDAILENSGTKRAIEEKVRLTMDKDSKTETVKAHNTRKNHHAHVMIVKKSSNAKKEIVKREKQNHHPKAAG